MKNTILFVVLLTTAFLFAETNTNYQELLKLAQDYFDWQAKTYPVFASDMGLHTYDDRLMDFSAASLEQNKSQIEQFQKRLKDFSSSKWNAEQQINYEILRSMLDNEEFSIYVLDSVHRDPQIYVGQATNGVFSLLKKYYAPNDVRARAATSRLKQVPQMLELGKQNLSAPVKLYTQLAIDAIEGGDSLFKDSLNALTSGISEQKKSELFAARDSALQSIHQFGDWLKTILPKAKENFAMGKKNYDFLLHNIFMLPISADDLVMLGQSELARAKAAEGWIRDRWDFDHLTDLSSRKDLPASEEEFLKRYEQKQKAIIRFLKEKKIVTIPDYMGPFDIRELPEAFKPTSPGGFMNAPGVYDQDPEGFYFIPTFRKDSKNFFLRVAVQDPRPILGHEGIPGHFLQISIANHHPDLIRRHGSDGVLIEGWAFYGEEMLLRTGMYADSPETEAQVWRLLRLRAARIAVDVKLATGEWTFDQAVEYLMKEGGMDREAAEGEAAGGASSPGQKIDYALGKYQIERLLGLYRSTKGEDFQLGDFHDALLACGSIPLSLVEWQMLGNSETFLKAKTMMVKMEKTK